MDVTDGIFDKDTAILCNTAQEANELCSLLHTFGYAWTSGDTLYNNSKFRGLPEIYNVYPNASPGDKCCIQHGQWHNGENSFARKYRPRVITLEAFKRSINFKKEWVEQWL